MKKILKRLLISVGVAAITFLVSFLGIVNSLDYMVTDFFYQRPKAVSNNIKIIAIDEKSLDAIGAYNTWDRSVYADLLNKLYEDGSNAPELVVFDVIFQGEKDAVSDAALADAAAKTGGVVAATNMVFKERVETDETGRKFLNSFYVDMVEYPYPSLLKNATPGFADSIQDIRDDSVRNFFVKLSGDGVEIPSLSYAAAQILRERGRGEINIPDIGPAESLILKYNGAPGAYEALSFIDVLEGKIPPEALRGCVLFVGAYAPGMMDAFSVPTGRGSQMYGVEIHANILESLQTGGYMENINKIKYSGIYAAIAFLFTFLALYLPILIVAILAVVLIVAQFIIGVVLAGNHLFLPLITLPVALILISVGSLVGKYFASLAQRRKVLKAFRQYVAPQIVEEIAKKGDYTLKLGGEKRHIAVLFVDIRGFTPLSEALKPEQVVEILNEYLSLTTKAIFDNLGTLDKFVGDATMAVFNSPFDLDDYIYRAVCTARDIVAGSEEIRKKAFKLTGKEVGFGVGVNCGEAIVGNIGCDFRMDYTAIGDTVNTAARLEANAGAGQVLLSPAVIEALGDRIETESIGELALKGKAEPMNVYRLVKIND